MTARDGSFFEEIAADAKRVTSPVRDEWERTKARQVAADTRPAPKVKRRRRVAAPVAQVTREEQATARAEWAAQQARESRRPEKPAEKPVVPTKKPSRWGAMELD